MSEWRLLVLSVTHSCIIATVQLYHPDGSEARREWVMQWWRHSLLCLRVNACVPRFQREPVLSRGWRHGHPVAGVVPTVAVSAGGATPRADAGEQAGNAAAPRRQHAGRERAGMASAHRRRPTPVQAGSAAEPAASLLEGEALRDITAYSNAL